MTTLSGRVASYNPNLNKPGTHGTLEPVNLLAVETSGRTGSIALLRTGAEPVERPLGSDGRRHAQTLVSDADQLMSEFQLQPRDVDCVAVSIGPGSFTGLRVGVVFAKTFGWLNKCPIVAVPTFNVIAAQVTTADIGHIGVIADAQRGELFLAEFTRECDQTSASSEVTIVSIDEVQSRLTEYSVLTGPGLARYAGEFDGFCRLADESEWYPTAASIAMLGKKAFDTGNIADPWKLEPFYLRRSAAEEKRDATA